MTTSLFLVLLLGASVYAMPMSPLNLNKDELKKLEVSSLLMPGPVLLPGSQKMPPSVSSSQGYVCELCELVVKKVDDMLKDKSTEEEIKTQFDQFCKWCPKTAECKKFIDDYVDKIIQELESKDPKMVCTELGLCQTAYKELKVRNEVNAIGSSPRCMVCELLTKELESLITKDSTQKEIKAALKQACNILPSSYKSECNNLIAEYTRAILKALANEFSPKTICTAIKVCSSYMDLQARSSSGNGTVECEICLKVLGIAKKLVEDNETMADVEKTLKLICWYMLPVKSECDAFIDKFVPLVFNELRKLDPETICKQLKLCPSGFMSNDIRCFLNGINHCESPELAKLCGTEAYCKLMKGPK